MLKYVRATKEHFEDFFRLRCEPENIKWAGHINAPDKSKLLYWFVIQLSRCDRLIYLFYKNNEIVGYFYIDKFDDFVEISFGVSSKHSNQNFGCEMVQIGFDIIKQHYYKKINAWVSEKNFKSIEILKRNKFNMTSEFEFRKLPQVPGGDKFYLWSICL